MRGPCVVWSAPTFSRSGIGEEARNSVLALDRAGVRVVPNAILPDAASWAGGASTRRLEELAADEPDEGFAHVIHSAPSSFFRHPRAARHIGRTMLETVDAPAVWVEQCSAVDELWVPCDLNLEAFERAGVPRDKLHKIPEALDAELYAGGEPPLELEGASGFVFLSVMGWTRRKGWDVLVRAYLDEFEADEDVTLVLKATAYFGRPVAEGVAELQAFVEEELGRDPSGSARIVVLALELGPEAMPRLYRAADAYVMATRGEGWGRPYMEAMAAGLPTIGTGWGGNLEFMSEDNAYLIEYALVDVPETAWRERPFLRGHRWAEPSVDHLRRLMRRVLERPDEAREKAARGRSGILSRFAWDAVGALMAERLEATL